MKSWIWWKSVPVSFVTSFVGAFAFARVDGATWEHSLWIAIGMSTIAVSIHRFIVAGVATDREK